VYFSQHNFILKNVGRGYGNGNLLEKDLDNKEQPLKSEERLLMEG
jgi:hypothetical protein